MLKKAKSFAVPAIAKSDGWSFDSKKNVTAFFEILFTVNKRMAEANPGKKTKKAKPKKDPKTKLSKIGAYYNVSSFMPKILVFLEPYNLQH
jgi:hypothetical protein